MSVMTPTLRSLKFAIGFRCNLRCGFCLQQTSDRVPILDFSLVEKILSESMVRRDVNLITLTGGEPTFDPYLELSLKITSLAHKQGKEVCIFTNGTLLNEETIHAFSQAGLSRFRVSIYDPINWEWVEGLMKMFGEHGFPKMLKYTVTRDNFDFLPVVLASLPLTGMEWFQIKPYNRVEDVLIDSQYELLPWQVLEMSNLVLNFRKANPGIKVDMLPLCYEFLLSDLPIGSLSHCNCGKGERGYLVIGPTGDIRICGAYPKPIGNANKDSISELWETHPLLLEVRGLANREKPEECKGCKHWDKCAATDCHSATFAKFGDFTHGNPQCPYLSTKRLMT